MAAFSSPALAATAATDVPDSCDAAFMDVLNSRAWMEGKREMETAQKLILKPDSILEYSCFDTRLTQMANASASIFGDSSNGIDQLVRSPTTAYLNDNFGHTLGGGSVTGSPGGTCAAMYAIWDFLKCSDFDEADFQTFSQISTNDRRTLPAACANPAARNTKWTTEIATANPPPALPGVLGGIETAVTFRNLIDPANCAAQRPILTGLKVVNPSVNTQYDDAICAAPGCHYRFGNLTRCF